MKFEGNFSYLGKLSVAPLQAALRTLGEDAWSSDLARLIPVHRHSRGIFLKNDLRPEHHYGTYHELPPRLREALSALVEELRPFVPGTYLIRCQLSRHAPGFGFDLHTDEASYTLMHSRRIHVPIVTNDAVWFSVGGERRHLATGEAWEINNALPHEGKNDGTTDRVHLIVDFAIPITTAAERLTYFLNLEKIGRSTGLLLAHPGLGASPAATPGPVTSFAYRLTDRNTGELLCTTQGDQYLNFVPGLGQLPRAIEAALISVSTGSSFELDLAPNEAFGERVAELERRAVSRLLSGRANRPTVLVSNGPAPTMIHLSYADPGAVTFDGNHPYAGRRLKLEGQVRGRRALDSDESKYALYRGPTLPNLDTRARELEALVRRFEF